MIRVKIKKKSSDLLLISLFLLLCGAGQSVFAQRSGGDDSARIERIRRTYQEIDDVIKRAEKNFPESEIFLTELAVNKGGTSYPAIGTYGQILRFYYTYGDRETDPYPNRLLKITVSTQSAARRMYAEYVFGPDGDLIFYFGDDGETENRLYFSDKQLIRWQNDQRLENTAGGAARKLLKKVSVQKDRLVRIFRQTLD